MSKQQENNSEEKKIVTKYDLKMQKREEAKKQAKKDQLMGTLTGVVIVVALAAFVLSFPIRSWLTVNGTYVKVGGEKVSRVEFDYHYNNVKNNYINQYGQYMSMYGIDLSGDLSNIPYSDTLTWQDFFEQMAVEDIINKKSMAAHAKAEGFTYDVAQDYKDYISDLKKEATEQGMNLNTFMKELYGTYATEKRIKPFAEETLYTTEYYNKISEEKKPAMDAIQAYYDENKDDYDSVDYCISTIYAELPTEPTELADPVEETETAEGEEEKAYQPSEAEIAHAMELAKAEANVAEKTIATDGELRENVQKSSMSSYISEWLMDASRKQGDTTVIENSYSNCYYVLAYEKRYLDQTPSIDARIILGEGLDGQAIIDEWNNGTEESFAALADKYNTDTVGLDGGLYEALLPAGMPEEMAAWAADDRKPGDVTFFTPEGDTYTYVVYYVAQNDPSWVISIENSLLSETMTNFVTEVGEGYEVEDPKGNLNYLKVQAAEEAASTEE